MKITFITVYNIELTLEDLYWLSEIGITPILDVGGAPDLILE